MSSIHNTTMGSQIEITPQKSKEGKKRTDMTRYIAISIASSFPPRTKCFQIMK